jgi:pimeloyl-ACP methyl ester carboxylesterase
VVAVSLYHESAGEGPPVVLVHSGICDSRMWDRQMRTLAADHQVVRLDLPGYGRSPVRTRPLSYAGEVLAVMDEQGIASAALVGSSFGGRVVLDVARTAPDRVRALVLEAPGRRDWDWSDAVRRYSDAEEEALSVGDLDKAVELNVRFWLVGPRRAPDEVDAGLRTAVTAMQRRAFENVLAGPGGEPPDPEPPGSEADVRAQALILIGDLDVPDMQAIAAHYERELPSARKVVMPGVAHLPSLERPEEFDRLVLDFLAR